MVKHGTYPVSYGLIDWISNRFDAVDYSNFEYWYRKRHLINLFADYQDGTLSRRSAERVLSIYNKNNGTSVSLDEIEDMDDSTVFSPAGDDVVFCDNIRGVIRNGEELKIKEPLEALSREEIDASWVILYSVNEGLIHALKTPHIKYREVLREKRTSVDGEIETVEYNNFGQALSEGPHPTFVFPDEVHGIIRQEKRSMRNVSRP